MHINFNSNIGMKINAFTFKGTKKPEGPIRPLGSDTFEKNSAREKAAEMSDAATSLDAEARILKGQVEAKVKHIVNLYKNNGANSNNRTVAAIAKGSTEDEKIMGETLEDGVLRISKFRNDIISNVSEYTGAGRKNEIVFYKGEPVLYFENTAKEALGGTKTDRILNIEYGEIAAYKKGIIESKNKTTVEKSLKYSSGSPRVYGEGYEYQRPDGNMSIKKELWYSKEGDPEVYQENYSIKGGRETIGQKVRF